MKRRKGQRVIQRGRREGEDEPRVERVQIKSSESESGSNLLDGMLVERIDGSYLISDPIINTAKANGSIAFFPLLPPLPNLPQRKRLP